MNESLQPTLWRTCRILANTLRLGMLKSLNDHGPMTVTEMAAELKIPMSAASEQLRGLNSRGLIQARRQGRFVHYTIGADPLVPDADTLLNAVLEVLTTGKAGESTAFRALTALTHYRRHCILYVLHQTHHLGFGALVHLSNVSKPALKRHLKKLLSREFIIEKDGLYRLAHPKDPLHRCLLDLAAKPPR